MATAYAALLSLDRSLHQILHLDPLIHKERIISLHEKVDSIVTLLEDHSEKHRGTLDRLGNEIRNAAHEAQDFMDSYLCSVATTHDALSLDRDLDMAFERIHFIWEKATKIIKKDDTTEDLRFTTHFSRRAQVTESKVVEFDDDFNAIKEYMYEDSSKLQIIPIVGMGGIGKTTLAKRAYDNAGAFDICAWATASAEYKKRETLSELLQCFKKYTTDANHQSGESEAQLAKRVYQILVGRRYLIVIDDIWSRKAWDDLKMIFPDNDNQSRILLTTRLSDVAVYAGSSTTSFHQMKFLNENQSWKLLEEKIFGQESCPLHLVELGKKVARNCRGLPLTIVVVAGLLLSSGNMKEQELWESILENISSIESTIQVHCSKILSLSYDWLPPRLKPCFLYMAAFPEDFEIDITKLIMLWVAEGFIKPCNNNSKCLEEVGKGYLEDLVNRNLILVSKKGPDGKLVAVRIHDLLRKICIAKAEEGGFLHHLSSTKNACNDAVENPKRRLVAHYTKTLQELRRQDSCVRSVFSEIKQFSVLPTNFKCLGILNSPKVTWWNLSEVISTSINLRYISFILDENMPHLNRFLASLSKLPNLETLISNVAGNKGLQVPYAILCMPKIRHLIVSHPFRLSDPSNKGTINESDLQTLDIVTNFIFTEDVIKMLVNLKQLKVVFDGFGDNWDDFNLNNLSRLQNLEELEVSLGLQNHFFGWCAWPNPFPIWKYSFPISLKKLTLQGVPFLWENMTIFGLLPELQVLKIVENNIREVSEWTTVQGQFLQLKSFCSSLDYLAKWEVEKDHFPSLESLILRGAVWIDEIPCGLGEIDSLQLIELQNCKESLVNSAKQIEEERHEIGDVAFQVKVFNFVIKNNF